MNSSDPRVASRKRLINCLDPVYLFLDLMVFERLFRPLKRNVPGDFEQLATADVDFLLENLNKHRIVLWLNVILAGYLWLHGLTAIFSHGDPTVVVTGLLAPAMITGGAWYAVSFGGIPEKYINTALVLTLLMFLSFTFSMTLLVALLCRLTPWPVGIFVLIPVYGTLYIASILYDNLDGLKIGLDTALLKFSRATLNYYQKHGFVTRRETETDVFDERSSDRIALFTHYSNMLERNLQQLESDRVLEVANRLIASSVEILFHVIDLSQRDDLRLDKGSEFGSYVKDAHRMSQEEVDSATIGYLGLAIEAFKAILGAKARGELDAARAALEEFSALRKQPESKFKNQEFADHLFSHVFQLLLSLMNTHRIILFQGHTRGAVAS